MKKKIFSVAAIIFSSYLYAQDTAKLQEVTLTASKFSTKTTSTGKVVTLITREDIEHAGSRDLAQVITEFGGVFINGFNSNAGKEKNIYLRGARVEYTLITVDGVPVYDASGIGSNFDIRNIPIDNIERIEILKGSQSTLYGSDAIAGVINIITKKASKKPLNITGAAHYGSYNTRRGNLGLSGSSGIIDYNLGYTHWHTDGFSEAKRPDNVSSNYDNDAYTQNSVQAGLGLRLKPVYIQPFLRYSKIDADLDQDAFTDEKDYTSGSKNLQAGVRNVIKIGKGELNALYQYTSTRRSYLDDSTGSRNGYYIYKNERFHAAEHFAEAFLVTNVSPVRLTVGADLRSSRNTTWQTAVEPPFPPFSFYPATTVSAQSGDSVNQHQVGVYAAVNTALHAIQLEAGARYNHHSEYGGNFAFNVNPSLFLKKRWKLFTNISSGYRTPSLYQLFSNYGNPSLKPERSMNIEGGAQYFGKSDKWNLRATYFKRRVEDAIAFFTNPVTFESQYINQDRQKDHGVEVDGQVKISSFLQMKLNYSYVDGEITTRTNSKDTTYFNLLRRPKHTWNLFAGVQATKAFYLSLQLNLVGERQDVYFDPSTFAASPVTLPSYALLNFYAEYGFLDRKLKLFADIRNILDNDYMDIYGYNTAGLNAYGGIRFNF